MEELPVAISNALERRGLMAITKEEYESLQRPPEPCPYPLFPSKLGPPTHREYVRTLEDRDGEDTVVVMRCAACGNVTFEPPVSLA